MERFQAQCALAALACTLAAYTLAGTAAGGADWWMALALVAAMPPLLAPPDRRGAAQIGIVAAFAASSKAEGVPLAAFLAAAYALRLWRAGRSSAAAGAAAEDARPRPALDPRAVLALGLPAALLVVPWLAEIRLHHLFQDFNAGPLQLSRAPRILAALATSNPPEWHRFQYCLLALPLLALDRRLRAIAAVALLQLLFYLYVFFSVRVDPLVLIALSWPRLILHLLPVALLGAAIAPQRPAAPSTPSIPSAGARLPPPGVHPDEARERHDGGEHQEGAAQR